MRVAYFPHDYNARTDPKLQQVMMTHGLHGIGAFWCIVEMMYEQGGRLPTSSIQAIAYNLHTTCELVESIIKDFDLFVIEEDFFSSKAVKTRIVKKEEISEMKRRAVMARWEKRSKENNTDVLQELYNNDTDVLHVYKESDTDVLHVYKESDTDVLHGEYRCNTIYKEKEIKEKENNIKENIKQATSRFFAPSIEQIQAYITEKGYIMSAEEFFYFYDSKGWMVGKTKMKNWRSAVSRWAAEDARRNNNKSKQYAQPNNNTDKRRGFDVSDGAEYTTGMF